MRSGSALETTARAATSRPSASTIPARSPVGDQHPLDRARRARTRAPGRLGGAPQRRGHRAHPAARVAPRAGRAGRLAEVVVEGDERGARVLRARRASRSAPGSRTGRVTGSDGMSDSSSAIEPSRMPGPIASRQRSRVGRLEHQRPRRAPRPRVPALGERAGTRRRRPALQSRASCARGPLAVRPGDDLAAVGQRREQVRLVDLDAQAVAGEVEVRP